MIYLGQSIDRRNLMNSPLFGGLFDLDNNGRMDPMERGAEIGLIYDVIDDEGNDTATGSETIDWDYCD
jgi:hypothetical protein